MNTVHLILQGKGGVGKSFAAFLLAQYLPEKSVLVRCFDADPINSTLASFPALNAVKIDLIETSDKGRRINPRRFDDLVEQIAGQPAEAHGRRVVPTNLRNSFAEMDLARPAASSAPLTRLRGV